MKVPRTGGSTDGPDGSTDGPDGSTSGPDGSTNGPDGSTNGPDGSSDGPDGSTDGLDGSAGSVGAWLAGVECLEDWERNLRLGDLHLDTSAQSECARARFIIGLLALHNFQFDLAQEEFEKADKVEQEESGRSYPMAMWGAAMATTMILWQYSDCDKGPGYMDRVYSSGDPDWITEKEKAYIQTGFALYPKDRPCKEDKQPEREKRLMEAMEKMKKQFPEETEAALFYAVSSQAVASQKSCKDCQKPDQKTLETLKALEKKYPTHTGLIHYIIHVYDTPELYAEGNKQFLDQMVEVKDQTNHAAEFGIKAADKYPQVANSSCHALHMPSHVYIRLGDWKRSLDSNLISIEVKCEHLVLHLL